MKKLLPSVLVLGTVVFLGGCVITPPSVDYIGPRVDVIRPAPYYVAPSPYYAPYHRHPSHRRHGHRHWN